MPKELLVVLSLWGSPIAVYVLRATRLIGVRTAEVLYGILCVVISISFIALAMSIYVQVGESFIPRKGEGPRIVMPDESIVWHLVAWGFWLWICGTLVHVGWQLIRGANEPPAENRSEITRRQ